MTCIVGLVDKGIVYIGGDSAGVVRSCGASRAVFDGAGAAIHVRIQGTIHPPIMVDVGPLPGDVA